MTKISAITVADSLSPQGERLWSGIIVLPRFILAELNTHRMLSKNSASSRAIPSKVMLNAVKTNPFIPIAWQKEHKGMQGSEYFTDTEDINNLTTNWLISRSKALEAAKANLDSGVTKQIGNRLLEPFMWHTVLISGTEWENFFDLRCPQYEIEHYGQNKPNTYYRSWKEVVRHFSSNNDAYAELNKYSDLQKLQCNKGQAEIHMMALAEVIWDAQNESTPNQLHPNSDDLLNWHIPFRDRINPLLVLKEFYRINGDDVEPTEKDIINLYVKISTAMAARTSYTVVGDEKEISYERLIGIHDRMIAQRPFHASPFEHCARVMSNQEHSRLGKNLYNFGVTGDCWLQEEGWCRNYRGFIQYRHFVENNTQI